MMRTGNSKIAGVAVTIALASLGVAACGSGSGGGDDDAVAQRPALSAATADRLAELSDRVASDLDAGDTCHAAHAADDLSSAVEEADLPDQLRPDVAEVAGQLVDEVNCPPPPEPVEKEKKPKEEHSGDHQDKKPKPSGDTNEGALVPPGKAKLKGETG
jgi:hypothetical protein